MSLNQTVRAHLDGPGRVVQHTTLAHSAVYPMLADSSATCTECHVWSREVPATAALACEAPSLGNALKCEYQAGSVKERTPTRAGGAFDVNKNVNVENLQATSEGVFENSG